MSGVEGILQTIAGTTNLGDLRAIRLAADKAIKAQRPTLAPADHFSPWALAAAQVLWELVSERYRFMKEPDLRQWANDIDKLNRVDNFQPELVQAVIRWSQNDQFWRQQVRSGANLRKHFTQMLVRIKEEQSNRKGVTI